MIIDTTYLLPLARVGVETDLLRAIVEKRVKYKISLGSLKVSMISIFELQAKASKLGIPPSNVAEAINAIFKALGVVPFYREDIIYLSHELYQKLRDYIDSIIVATAITHNEALVTEDEIIHLHKVFLKENYDLEVLCYKDLVK